MESRYIDIHTHAARRDIVSVTSYRAGTDLHEPPAPFSAGIHPWDAGKGGPEPLLEYLRHSPAVAIGEIGLDYIKPVDRQTQRRIFEQQLAIAEQRMIPVILHCVRAYNDMVAILPNYRLPAVIFHGYTGSPEQTSLLTARGYYLSFGPVSLGSAKTRESLVEMPLERVFAETDDSGMPVEQVYEEIAKVRGISICELSGIISKNYKTIFG